MMNLAKLTPYRKERAEKLLGYLSAEERAQLDILLLDYEQERQRFKADPLAFVSEILGAKPAPYQEKIFTRLVDHRRVCVRGPHGMGKTTTAAWIVLWFLSVHEECKIPTTASAWRQLTEFLWPEIHKWALRANWPRIGLRVRTGMELLENKLVINKNRFAFALSSKDEAKIEGAHSEAILYLFDEAKTIDPAIWDAAEGALSVGEAYAAAFSTPGESVGRFYDIQLRKEGFEDWSVVHVTKQECIAAGRMNEAWAEQKKKAWGETSVLYQRRVEGNFAEDETTSLIKLADVERSQDRWRSLEEQVRVCIVNGMSEQQAVEHVWGRLEVIGVDVGRDKDKSAFAFRHTKGVRKIELHFDKDLMTTVERIVKEYSTGVTINIDTIGIGAGVVDRLRQMHRNGEFASDCTECPVAAINVGVATKMRDTTNELVFACLRDWIYWHMRELLTPATEDEVANALALPPIDTLTADLIAPHWTTTSTGKIKVEDKDSIRKRLGRSPDSGDSVLLAFFPESPPFVLCVSFM